MEPYSVRPEPEKVRLTEIEVFMNNKSIGTIFEKEFVSILAHRGFWVHLFQDNKNGQPCDVVASRSGHTYLFDCKECKGDTFRLSRMEENQLNAMELFEITGNSRGRFAVRFPGDEIYLSDYRTLKVLRNSGVSGLKRRDFQIYGQSLQSWLNYRDKVDEWSEKHESNDWK